jgi:hypothetical protein
MDVSMKNTDIHSVLAGLKLLESDLTTRGEWAHARKAGRLHLSLLKQVFDFVPEEDDTDE